MSLSNEAIDVAQPMSTIRTFERKLSYNDAPHLPQRKRKPKCNARHFKPLIRVSSTPPILDRFSPYRHRSRIPSPARCQKAVCRKSPSKHETFKTKSTADNNETTPGSSTNTWPLSPIAPSSVQSLAWNQTTINRTASPAPSDFSSGQPAIQQASRLPDGQTRSYHLDVVQHPVRTAEFGSASLSRLPLAPPIVVQLVIRDPAGHAVNPDMELPFLIAHLSLFTGDGTTPLDMGSAPGSHAPPRRLLYGNLVSSPQKLRDLQGRQGLFFLFPDVSIRWCGQFQLGITLLRLSGMDASGALSVAEHGTVLAQARTRQFEVLSHDNYIAPAQTRLTQCFLRQGARIHTYATSPH